MLFEEIMERQDDKKIVSLCKKLNKKCSFASGADAANLCELAYRLYVMGAKEDTLRVCEFTNIDIPAKINYNVWDFILFIWGLEAYIYNENGRVRDKEERIAQMKKVWSTSKNASDTEEKAWAFMQKIFARKTIDSVCDIKEIEEAEAEGDKKSANATRLTALYNMIGYGITGFCPELVNNRDELEAKIREYVICLQ